ncbi:MAG: hypothetical protein ACYSSN_05715 [Planctomycetota bacterium]|jgi:hypothetical protein
MNETDRKGKNPPQEKIPKKPWISLIEGKGSKKAKRFFKAAIIFVIIAFICFITCAIHTIATVEDETMFTNLIGWVLLLATASLFALSFILALIGCTILIYNRQLRLNKKITLKFFILHLLITLGFIFLSYISYPVLWDTFGILTTNLLREIHDEVILYKNETGSLPENLNNLLYYDAENHDILFNSKLLKGKLHYISIGFPEEEIKGSGINKLFHYEIIDDKPVIYTLGYDDKEGGDDDYFYPTKRFIKISFHDFLASEFFVNTLLFGIPWTFAVTLCLFRMKKCWSKNPIQNTLGSIAFFIFACIVTAGILLLHVYPHH